jgi:hypothetical protein
MLTFEFLPAQHGDCILVRWGAPERVMVIDGGPDGVYESVLRPRLMALTGSAGRLAVDVLCVSHVDDDHVVGVIRLLKELVRAKRDQLPLPIDVHRVWFNSVDDLIEGVQPGLAASVRALVDAAPPVAVVSASYGQGRDVRDSLAALCLEGNAPFGHALTVPSSTELYGLTATVVGPSTDALAKLVEKWRASAKANDAKPVAAAYTDRSVPNLSSIALHICCAGRSALLTGDARGDHLLAGLEEAGVLAPKGTLHVDVFKLPHHGSENNAEPSLFERVRADHYVVCADGIKHAHPSDSTLEWLVASRAGDEIYTVHLTNPIPAAEATLEKLAAGRSFSVKVGTPRVEISLEPTVPN